MNTSEFNKYLKDSELVFLNELKKKAEDNYYNSGDDNILTDEQFDTLKEYLRKKDVNFKDTVGAKLRDEANRVKLEIPMRSMDKITDEKGLSLWKNRTELKNGWVCQTKLDGVSGMLVCRKNGNCNLYTRGDGEIGADISYLVKYIKGIPKKLLNSEDDIFVRGELIIDIDTFNEKWKNDFSNSRNMVSGCVNAKTLKKGTEDINFIAYELIDHPFCKKPSQQISLLNDYGFKTVLNFVFNSGEDCNINMLSTKLSELKNNEKFQLDGIIIRSDNTYKHNIKRNPKNAIAYKEQSTDNVATSTVINVLWDVSKWKQLKPRVEIIPVDICGVTVTYVTAHNAKYVIENNIHVGMKIKLTRSGDVIPKIIETFDYDKTKVKLPDCKWEWNDTNVEIICTETNDISDIKRIHNFFEKIGCKNIGEKIVTKIYNEGFITIEKILEASVDDFLKLEGFKETLAQKIHKSIHENISKVDIPTALSACGVFGIGFGHKKIEKLFNEFPKVLTTTDYKILKDNISKIEGFSEKSSIKIIEKLKDVSDTMKWLSKYLTHTTYEEKKEQKSKYYVVFSGFRDEELKNSMMSKGVNVQTNVNKETNYVIVKEHNFKETNKTKEAKKRNIEIITKDIFLQILL